MIGDWVAEISLRDVVFGESSIVWWRRREDGVGTEIVRSAKAVFATTIQIKYISAPYIMGETVLKNTADRVPPVRPPRDRLP